MSKHRRPGDRRPGLVLAAASVAAITLLSASSPALAARGGGGGGGKGGKPSSAPAPTGTFSLVLLDGTDGQPHWGQQVTFDVTSTASYTFVDVDCYQAGTHVYRAGVGFYAGWPWSQNFTLKSGAWSSGAADCAARLYATNADGTNDRTLATMTFPVAA